MQLTPMAVAVLAFAAFFFAFSPRLGGGGWQPGSAGAGIVGFSKEISFRDLGRLIESDAVAMRASFHNEREGKLYPLYNEPYFRGAALTQYSFGSRNPTWSVPKRAPRFWNKLPRARVASETADRVRQDIVLRPTRDQTLFGVAPFYLDDDTPPWVGVSFSSNTMKIDSPDMVEGAQALRYSVFTTGLQAGGQAQIIRQFPNNPESAGSPRRTKEFIETYYRDFNPDACPTIAKVAAEQLEDQRNEGRIFQCQLLMRYLLSDQFTYSLDTSEIRAKSNPGVDPVEDFFANHKTGYCGHFASALALMLRSQEIPSRVVVGYKGGEFNDMGGYYVVRSRHAHSWVEAYLRPSDLDGIADAADRDIDSEAGAWLRLDPTPTSSQGEFDKGAMHYVDQVLDYSRSLWSDYVLNATSSMDSSNVSSVGAVNRSRRGRSMRDRIRAALPAWSWSLLGLAPIVIVLAAAIWALIRNFPVIRSWRLRRAKSKRRPISSVEFYNRLEKLASRQQLWRREDQTPREFADVIADHLREGREDRGPAGQAIRSLENIIHAFYETRFGGRALDSIETEAIEQALREVSKALAAQSA